jgi:hypothetical protein
MSFPRYIHKNTWYEKPPRAAESATTDQKVDGMLEDLEGRRSNVAGFAKAEKPPGNIGLI